MPVLYSTRNSLSHLSERQNVQNRTPASRQMQKPAGVDEMSTVSIANPIWPASCEKNTLFRYGILLPKIEYASIIRSRMGQSITFLLPIHDQFQLKTDIICTASPVYLYETTTSTRLKPHSSRHAA